MAKMTEAEEVLLEQIREGRSEAWDQFVSRYRGRLLSFARTKMGQRADAEDAVQDTFIAFLTGLDAYRGQASLETYLFTILRRKIINSYRSAHAKHICLLQDVCRPDRDQSRDSDAFGAVQAPDMTASFYVRRDEQGDRLREALAAALERLVNNYKTELKFREMKIVEMLFYCQLGNQDCSRVVQVDERNIAVIKHRCLKQVREHVVSQLGEVDDSRPDWESLLTEVWEAQRLSCPKRSTVGAFLLGTLDGDWADYVDFHCNQLGCHFCRANLEDLKRQTAADDAQRVQRRIMESTVGFLRKA